MGGEGGYGIFGQAKWKPSKAGNLKEAGISGKERFMKQYLLRRAGTAGGQS